MNHLPHSNQQQQHHNPNIHLNDHETTSIAQLKPLDNMTSLLASLTVEKLVIQAVISSVETFNGTNRNFEAWIVSVENAAQLSG